MQLNKLLKRNGFIVSKVWLCFFSCLFVFYSYSVQAAISTVASEQSGTTVNIINHVGAGTFATRNNCGSINPSIPAGSVDDLLIAVALVREQNATVTMDANWTLAYTENFGTGGNETEAYIFYRIATNDALDTNTMTSAGAGNCRSLIGQVSRFDGVDTASPFENAITVGVNSSAQNTATVVTGTETTTSATAMSIVVTFISDNATVTEADGFSESFDSTSTVSRDSAISLNYRQESTAGAKGAFTWTQNLGVDENIAVLFALTPDGTNEGISIKVPAGTTTDDVMLAAISVRPSSTAIAAPAGWTLINRVDQAAGASNSQAVYQRVATASEPAAYTWGFSGGAITGTAGGIITYRGVDTVTPIDAFGGNTTVSGTSHTANSINTTVANTMIVSTHSFSSSETWTPPVTPAGMTEQVDVASLATPNALGISLEMNDVLQAAIGATGNITATAAGNADTGVAQIIALTPLIINENITVTFTGGPVDDVVAGSISITDAALGTPEFSAASTNGVGQADITTNIGPTLTTNALLIDIVGKPRGNGTYTPGAGQTEQFDIERQGNNNGLTGAMSTKQVSLATESMVQTHSSATRQNAHAVVSVAPATSTASYDADASRTAGNTSSFSWSHSFTTTNFVNTKLVVGLTYRDAAACGTVSVSTLTIGGLPFNQITSTSVTDTDSGDCIYAELWYADLNNIILSTQNNSSLGGQAIDQDEAVEYEGFSDTGSLFIDDAIFSANERINALHYLDNGNIALSITGNDGATIGGTFFEEDDIVEVTIDGTFVQELFSEDNFTSAEDNARDVDAVYIRDNGDLVFSTVGTETIQQCGQPVPTNLTITDDDIVEWDVSASCGTIVVSFAPLLSGGGDEDIDGLHYLNDDPNMLLISILNNQTLDSQAFTDGDVILYDRNTSTAYLYMDEGNFTADEEIDALTLTINPVTTATIDHYDIDFSSAMGITCLPVDVTITAKDSSNATVNHSSDTTIDFNVSTNLGQWATTPSSGTGTITDPTPGTPDNGDLQYEFPSGENSVTIPLSYTEFAVAGNSETFEIDITTTPDEDGGVANADDDPSVTFEFTAIIFNNVDDGNNTVTTQISGKPSNVAPSSKTYSLQVLNADEDDPTVCQSIFGNGDIVSIELGAECKNPSTCAGLELNIDNINPALPATGVDINTTDDDSGATTVTSYEAVNLQFGTDAAAEIVLNYPDAGLLELHARYELLLDDGVTGSGEYATGISNEFVVRPFGFDVQVTGNPAATGPGGARFTAAGQNFTVTARAIAWNSVGDTNNDGIPDNHNDTDPSNNVDLSSSVTYPSTPNYGQEGTDESTDEDIDLTAALNQPSPGGTDPGLSGGTSITTITSGSGSSTTVNYNEVGIIEITGQVAVDNDYLGGGNVIGKSGYVGRFGADQFTFTANTPVLGPACGTFTYVDQPFSYTTAPEITARATSADGTTVLSNYSDFTGTGGDNWWLLDFRLVADGGDVTMTYTDLALPTNISLDSSTATHSPNTGTTGSSGMQLFNLGGSFAYAKDMPPISEQIPFDGSFRLDFIVTDLDGATGTYTINPISFTNPQQRWGRMVLGNGFGSELLAIEVPLSVEYYNTDGFEINTADTCTTYDSADMSFSNADGVTLGNLTLAGSGTMVNGRDDPANSVLATSTANEIGSADVTIDLTSQDWLQFDWDSDTNYDNDPTARITWGIFSGQDEFIYIREPW